MRYLIILFFWLLYDTSRGSHIVGGSMSYQCLGSNQYRIQLILQKDCYNGDRDASFEDPASLGIYDENGILQRTLPNGGIALANYVGGDTLLTASPSTCESVGTEICIFEARYTFDAYLPFNKGGYILAYIRCCRNITLNNIEDPLNTGTAYTLILSEEALKLCNTIPEKQPPYKKTFCANKPFLLDVSLIDKENDQLEYRFCTPYAGGTMNNPTPRVPTNLALDIVNFKDPYRVTNLLNSNPPLSIDANTGIISGYTSRTGQYLVGVCVTEYRDNKYLSGFNFDFEINVKTCFDSIAIDSSHVTHVNGNTEGKIYVKISGGVGPYKYKWSTGATTKDVDNLAAGMYTLTITDQLNCTREFQFEVKNTTYNYYLDSDYFNVLNENDKIVINNNFNSVYSINLFDLNGQLMEKRVVSCNQYILDKTKFSRGMYVLTIRTKNRQFNYRITRT